MLSTIVLALCLCVLQLQLAYGNTPVLTSPFGLVDQMLQVAYNDSLINPPGLTIPLSGKSFQWQIHSRRISKRFIYFSLVEIKVN